MHFVKKVPTTEEENAAREKQRFAKLKTFCAVRDKIFQKRANNELDDEMLSLTQSLLEKNPDIYTFWNIRREAITQKIAGWKQCQETTEDEACNASCQKKIDDLLAGELFVTRTCLEANHKSYSAWFHRGWTLKQQTSPNIQKDLQMCEMALKLDCRNFHCWDHRRVVAKLGNLSSDEELEFSNRLISENFSNYSAWHYRATLLPRMQNDRTGQFRLDDATLAAELKKVTSAFFTDPNDQSAWVYTRWLVEMGSEKEFMRFDSAMPAVPLSVTFHGNSSTVVMSKAAKLDAVLMFVDAEEGVQWRGVSALSSDPKSAVVWQYLSDVPIKRKIDPESSAESEDVKEKPYANRDLLHKAFDVTTRAASPALETLIEQCRELYREENNNNMWALYTLTLCLMETRPVDSHLEIIDNLAKLANVLDTKRKEIYESLASRQLLNDALTAKDETAKILLHRILDGEETQLALRNKNINSVDGVELLAGYITDLDVSGNRLKRIEEILLPNLRSLVLNENPIKRLPVCAWWFTSVQLLSLASCQMDEPGDVIAACQAMTSLDRLLYCETRLVDSTTQLAEALPGVRLIPYWL